MDIPAIWAVVGRKGTGKDTVGEKLQERLGGTVLSSSGFLRAYADARGIDDALWQVEAQLASERGGDFMIDEALRMQQQPVFITGLRSTPPLMRLRKESGFVVFVTADWQTRHTRVIERQRPGEVIAPVWQPDDQYQPARVQNGGATWDEIQTYADYVIDNDGTLADLDRHIDLLLAHIAAA